MQNSRLGQLRKMAKIAVLLKETALADLASAAQACEATRLKLQGLEAPLPQESPLPISVLESAALLHRRWSEPRRMRLNEQLALEMAARLEAEAKARKALGRAEVIAKLCRKQAIR